MSYVGMSCVRDELRRDELRRDELRRDEPKPHQGAYRPRQSGAAVGHAATEFGAGPVDEANSFITLE
jgi:hypothetical protein